MRLWHSVGLVSQLAYSASATDSPSIRAKTYTIRRFGDSFTSDRVWLSTNSDGTAVDLWNVVGNWQRWVIEEHENGAYSTIRRFSDDTGDRVYLSTNSDGTAIDLWNEVGDISQSSARWLRGTAGWPIDGT